MKRILMICVMALFMVTIGVTEEYWKKIPYPENIDWGKIVDIVVENNGTIWICESKNIYFYKNNFWTTISCDSLGIIINSFNSIRIDKKNRNGFVVRGWNYQKVIPLP